MSKAAEKNTATITDKMTNRGFEKKNGIWTSNTELETELQIIG